MDNTFKDKYLEWLQKAAEWGDVDAMYEYSKIVGNKDESEQWLRKAADKGKPEAQYDYGKLFCVYIEKYNWIQLAADRGLSKAQYEISQCYKYGFEPYEKNWNKYVEWLNKSATQNYPDALADLGILLIENNISIDKGLSFLQESASQECTTALLKLGEFYEAGNFVTQNIKKSLEYYEAAARNACWDAIEKISLISNNLK